MAHEKKPPRETWESFTERKIREAQEEGAFENLPGFGRPIKNIDEPLDENWWVKDKLRREQISALPPILQIRLEVERTLEQIGELQTEFQVRRRIHKLNESIRQAHFSHVPGPAAGIAPLDTEEIVREWKLCRQSLSRDSKSEQSELPQ